MRPTLPLGPWPLGIDRVSAETALPTTDRGVPLALRDAVNVTIDRNGRPARRQGRAPVVAQPGLQRLWGHGGDVFAQAGITLFRVHPGALEPIAELNSADPVDYDRLVDGVVVANRSTLLRVVGNRVEPLAVPMASAPTLAPDPDGGLDAGRYTVGVSLMRGDLEGGLSRLRTVEVVAGGGLRLTGLPVSDEATALRIYRTTTNGETLYHAQDVPLGLPQVLLGAGRLGKDSPTRALRQMPPGEMVRAWNGRLVTVRGTTLYVSQPLAYHLHSPRHDWVQFPHRITMIAPVQSGIFVGSWQGVVFLAGDRPKAWQHVRTGALPPVPGSSTRLASGDVDPDFELGGQDAVAWLAPNGYVMGMQSGLVTEIQSRRMKGIHGQHGATINHNRRLTTALA